MPSVDEPSPPALFLRTVEITGTDAFDEKFHVMARFHGPVLTHVRRWALHWLTYR